VAVTAYPLSTPRSQVTCTRCSSPFVTEIGGTATWSRARRAAPYIATNAGERILHRQCVNGVVRFLLAEERASSSSHRPVARATPGVVVPSRPPHHAASADFTS
jgi:hypothetical protein